MYTFPEDLYIRTEFVEIWNRPTIRSRSELGYPKARATWAKTLRGFEIRVTTLDADEKETLRIFLESVSFGGNEFEFTHPSTGNTHIVALMDDAVRLTYIKDGVFAAQMTVMETTPYVASGS